MGLNVAGEAGEAAGEALQNQSPVFSEIVDLKGRKFPSYVQADGKFWKMGEYPLVISDFQEYEGKTYASGVLVKPEGCQFLPGRILWEGNGPKTVVHNKSTFFLLWDEDSIEDGFMLFDWSDRFETIVPHDFIEAKLDDGNDILLLNHNEDFWFWMSLSEVITFHIVDRDSSGSARSVWRDSTSEILGYCPINSNDLPKKEGIQFLDHRLVVWNASKREFEVYEQAGIRFENVSFDPDIGYSTNGIPFVMDHETGKPVMINLNGHPVFLLKDRKTGKTSALIEGQQKNIDIRNIQKVDGRDYCLILESQQGLPGGILTASFTDWVQVHHFFINIRDQILTHAFEGKEYPRVYITPLDRPLHQKNYESVFIGKLEKEHPLGISILKDGMPHFFIPKNSGEVSKVPDLDTLISESQPEYVKIQMTEEQQKSFKVAIFPKHGLVCLAPQSHPNDFLYFRIDAEGTLTPLPYGKLFKIEEEEVTVLNEGGVMFKNAAFQSAEKLRLVRRPGSSSVFEPIILNDSEYLVFRVSKEKILLGRIGKNMYRGWIEDQIFLEDFQVDPTTFLPASPLVFEWEPLLQTSDGLIGIGKGRYRLCNEQGEPTSSIDEATMELNEKKFLLMSPHNKTEDTAWVLYHPQMRPKILEVTFKERNGAYFETMTPLSVRILVLNGKKRICVEYDVFNNIVSLVSGIDQENVWDTKVELYHDAGIGKEIVPQEFVGEDGKPIVVVENISKKLVRSEDETMYRREGNILKKRQELPVGLTYSEDSEKVWCDPRNYNNKLVMKMQPSLVRLSEVPEHEQTYLLEWEINSQWDFGNGPCDIVNAWDGAMNEIFSYVKTEKGYEKAKIANRDVLIGGNWVRVYGGLEPFRRDANVPLVAYLAGEGQHGLGHILVPIEEYCDGWWKAYDMNTGERMTVMIYRNGSMLVAVDPRRLGYEITPRKNPWQDEFTLQIHGISYDKKVFDEIYANSAPEVGGEANSGDAIAQEVREAVAKKIN